MIYFIIMFLCIFKDPVLTIFSYFYFYKFLYLQLVFHSSHMNYSPKQLLLVLNNFNDIIY
jgi:hypothetical protein